MKSNHVKYRRHCFALNNNVLLLSKYVFALNKYESNNEVQARLLSCLKY